MPQAMTQHSPGSLDQWLYFLTQGTVPNLHQTHFFIFCVNKGFRFILVYFCLHYLLFKNEKVFCFVLSNVSPISTIKQDHESGVVSLCWTEIPDQNMIIHLNLLVATIMFLKNAHWLHFGSDTHPFPLSLPPKEREDEEIALNCWHSCGPCRHCKHPKQILSSAPGNKLPHFWLGSVSFQLFKLIFDFISPIPPPFFLQCSFLKSSHQNSASHASPRGKRASFWLA